MLNYFILNIFILYNIKMSESLRMNRSTFDAIKEHQQIEKYKALNTYNIFLNDRDSISYEDGVSPHNNFKFLLPDNQSSHIKNAKVRVKSVNFGTNAGNITTFSGFKVKSNFLQNCFTANGRTNGELGFFKIHAAKTPTNRTNVVPEIASALASNGNPPADSVFSNVAQNAHQILTTQFSLRTNPIGIPLDDSYIPCNNPFGKEISFEILTSNDAAFDLGVAAGNNTSIHLEVELLPDNQANDRFTY